MSSLTGNLISSTYQSLLKTGTNNPVSTSLDNITDGLGNATGLYVSTTTTAVSGTFAVLGSMTVSGVLAATASNAISASYALSSSFAVTASYLSGSIAQSISSSYAANADLLDGKNSTVFATTGSNILIGNQTITGSIIPGGLTYDLGSASAPWKEIYVSTGSINFVNNGAVVSSLGVNTNGTQVTGSMTLTSGSFRVSNFNSANSQFYTLTLNVTGSRSYIYSTGSAPAPLVLQHDGDRQIDQPVLVNTRTTFFAGGASSTYPGCVVIGGKSGSNGGAGLFFVPGGPTSTAPDWGIATDTNKDLLITTSAGFTSSNLKLRATTALYNAGNFDIKLSGEDASFMPSASALISLGTPSSSWINTFTSNLSLTPQSQPADPIAGQIYFNTSDSHFYGYNGTTWKQLDN
jgi:hypothetical protein